MLEMNLLVAELDGLQASIDEDLYAGRHGCGEAEVVGGGHAVHHGAGLIATRYGADDRPIIGNGCCGPSGRFCGVGHRAPGQCGEALRRGRDAATSLSTAARLPRSTKSLGVQTSSGL